MPMTSGFAQRLDHILPAIAAHFGTPFHLYDEIGIRETGASLKKAFAPLPSFQEFFAVKALPNPHILTILRDMGFGFDCSSIPELILARQSGAGGSDIMFTSNNTAPEEFAAALTNGGCILNLDDISLIDKVPYLPEKVAFRYNPGARRTGNAIIGKPEEAKFGVPHDQMLAAYQQAQARGAQQFGLHTMLVSNERDYRYMLETTQMLLNIALWLQSETGITLDFINIGGGFGIPYRPEDTSLDLDSLAVGIVSLLENFGTEYGTIPALYMENGRYLTGKHGVLVTRAINHKDSYRRYIGVDATMAALMRPGMYGAYHHITIHSKEMANDLEVVDVVGSLCENNDKFAIQRPLPPIVDGDLLLIHDTGAHGHAMGFNYNGRLRPQELLLRADGSVSRIRRAETLDDYFATLAFMPEEWQGEPR